MYAAGGSSSDTADLSHSVPALLQLEHVGHWSSHYARIGARQYIGYLLYIDVFIILILGFKDMKDTHLLFPVLASCAGGPSPLSWVISPLQLGSSRRRHRWRVRRGCGHDTGLDG